MAKHRKRPVFIFSQGIGPVNSDWGQKHVAKTLRKATKITVRDEDSAKMLHSWGLRKGRVRVTADPVLTMGNVERQWDVERFVEILKAEQAKGIANSDITEIEICIVDDKSLNQLMAENAAKVEAETAKQNTGAMNAAAFADAEEKITEITETQVVAEESSAEISEVSEEDTQEEKEPVLAVEGYGIMGLHPSFWKAEGERLAIFSVREWENLPVEDIAKVADLTAENGYKVVFLPFQYPNDVEVSNKVAAIMKEEASVFNARTPLTPQEILTVMDEADFVFGMRLHALVMAAVTKTPFASLSYNPKVASFVKQLGLTATGDLSDYNGEEFLENAKGLLENIGEVQETIEENLPELIEKAESVMDSLHTLLDRIYRRNARKTMTQEEKDEIAARRKAEREKLMPLVSPVTEEVPQEEVIEEPTQEEPLSDDDHEEIYQEVEVIEEVLEDEEMTSKDKE